MKGIELIRNDLSSSYRPIHYYDRYLITPEEDKCLDPLLDIYLDCDGLYGDFLIKDYERSI